MPVLTVKDGEAYRLASQIAEITGKSLPQVVLEAPCAENERVRPPVPDLPKARMILAQVNRLPAQDDRSGEALLAELYDDPV